MDESSERWIDGKENYTCHRRLHFSAGHRVFGHGGACANLHGHNYVVWISAVSKELDQIGMVVDFSVLRDVVGRWIDENWDHKFLLWEEDRITADTIRKWGDEMGLPATLYLCEFNPTAEAMAEFLHRKANELLSCYGVVVVSVDVFETDNCYATYR